MSNPADDLDPDDHDDGEAPPAWYRPDRNRPAHAALRLTLTTAEPGTTEEPNDDE